jgi:hypothetical protein
LAALPLLGHVGRAAARSGVPLRVLANDPLAGVAAGSTMDAAHASTATRERTGRSRVVFVGEGRGLPAGLALTTSARPAAAFAYGSMREEGQLLLDGLGAGAGSLSTGSAEPSQAATLRLASGLALIGPELFQAPADLRADVTERTSVLAANRLIGFAILALAIGAILSLTGSVDPAQLIGIDAG